MKITNLGSTITNAQDKLALFNFASQLIGASLAPDRDAFPASGFTVGLMKRKSNKSQPIWVRSLNRGSFMSVLLGFFLWLRSVRPMRCSRKQANYSNVHN